MSYLLPVRKYRGTRAEWGNSFNTPVARSPVPPPRPFFVKGYEYSFFPRVRGT